MTDLKVVTIENDELMAGLRSYCKEKDIKDAAIVSMIGAVDNCVISNMPPTDARKDIVNTYTEPLEASGSGFIENGAPHIHCVMSRKGEKTLAGHLHSAQVETWFIRIYLHVLHAP